MPRHAHIQNTRSPSVPRRKAKIQDEVMGANTEILNFEELASYVCLIAVSIPGAPSIGKQVGHLH